MNFIFNFYRYGTDTREQDRGKERDFIPEVHSGEARPHSVGRALGILRHQEGLHPRQRAGDRLCQMLRQYRLAIALRMPNYSTLDTLRYFLANSQ